MKLYKFGFDRCGYISMQFWSAFTYMHAVFFAEPIKMCTAVNDISHESTQSNMQKGTTFMMTVTFMCVK